MTKQNKNKYVLLAGGLTGGPVIPLLAVVKEWQKHDASIVPVLVDLRKSTSKIIAKDKNILFSSIITGKFRRYFAWQNFFSPFLLVVGLIQSLVLILKYRPVAVIGAGGFVQIPIIFMSWIFRIPRFIHQQDVVPTLSNQICAIFANRVTTTFEFSIRDFLQGTGLGKKYVTTNKVIWTGNPVEQDSKDLSKKEALNNFKLHAHLPVLLVMGGGSGSVALNEIISRSLPQLTKVVQIIHSTGSGKELNISHENYHGYSYIEDVNSALLASDLVLSRAGIGTLTSLAYHKKPSIIVPMPDTHQEYNAGLLYQTKSAIVLDQNDITPDLLIKNIRKILFDIELQKSLSHNLHELFPLHAATKIYRVISDFIDKNHGKQ